jgi:hypothetical protein
MNKLVQKFENFTMVLNEHNGTIRQHDTICKRTLSHNYSNEQIDNLMFVKYVVSGWTTLFIVFIGIGANSVAVKILASMLSRKSTTYIYLLGISISNVVNLVYLGITVGLRFTIVHPYRKVFCVNWFESFVNTTMPYTVPISNMFYLSGIYMMVALSANRLFSMNDSFRDSIKRKKYVKYTWLVVVLIHLFSVLYTLPSWFMYQTEAQFIYIDKDQRTIDVSSSFRGDYLLSYMLLAETDFGRNKTTKLFIHAYFYIPVVFALPLIALLVVNFFIIRKVVYMSNAKEFSKRKLASATSRSITIMLVMVVVLFLAKQVPLMILHILVARTPNFMNSYTFLSTNAVSIVIVCMSLSLNFLLFYYFSRPFRSKVKHMFWHPLNDKVSDRNINSLFKFNSNKRQNRRTYSLQNQVTYRNGEERSRRSLYF